MKTTKFKIVFKIKGKKKKAERVMEGLLRDMEHQAQNFEPKRYERLIWWSLK